MQNPGVFPVALVTGAARRIGACIASYLHDKGYNVVIHYNNSQKEAKELIQLLNSKRDKSAIGISSDLLTLKNTDKIIKKTIDAFKRLDVLINNASVFIKTEEKDTYLFKEDNEIWDKIFTINVKAPFQLSKCAFPYLRINNGCIINITDIHASKPLKDYAIYSQSKAALEMQTKSLASFFAPVVRVNAIAPGAIVWPEESNKLDNATKEMIINKTLLKKHGNPSNIAKAAYALIQNDYITGQILHVDGGRYL